MQEQLPRTRSFILRAIGDFNLYALNLGNTPIPLFTAKTQSLGFFFVSFVSSW